jgi:hypothetical protein
MTWWQYAYVAAVLLVMAAVYGRHLYVVRRRRRRDRERAVRRLERQQRDDRPCGLIA